MTTSVLGQIGIDLGSLDTMLQAAPNDNPRGFWEQDPIRILNDDLLQFLGGRWYDGLTLEPGWELEPGLEPFYNRAAELVARLFPTDRVWAWKDPRTALTLPFWKKVVRPSRYVFCFRNPVEVAASLESRNPIAHPRSSSLDLWLQHNSILLKETRTDPRLFVFFDDWFESTRWQIERLIRFAGVDLPPSEIDRIEASVAPDLRHQRAAVPVARATEGVPVEVAAGFELMWACAREAQTTMPDALQFVESLWDRRVDRRDEMARLTAQIEEESASAARLRQEVDALEQALAVSQEALLNRPLSGRSYTIESVRSLAGSIHRRVLGGHRAGDRSKQLDP